MYGGLKFVGRSYISTMFIQATCSPKKQNRILGMCPNSHRSYGKFQVFKKIRLLENFRKISSTNLKTLPQRTVK